MFLLVLGGLVGLALVILIVAESLSGSHEDAMSKDEDAIARLEERIQPVGQVSVAGGDAAPIAAPTATTPADSTGDATAEAAEVTDSSVTEEPAAGEASTAAAIDGEAMYNQACVLCHGAGLAGAPKLGDTANWAPRIAQGMDTVYGNAINGFQGSAGIMPAKGGRADLSDDAINAAVDYMVENSQ